MQEVQLETDTLMSSTRLTTPGRLSKPEGKPRTETKTATRSRLFGLVWLASFQIVSKKSKGKREMAHKLAGVEIGLIECSAPHYVTTLQIRFDEPDERTKICRKYEKAGGS